MKSKKDNILINILTRTSNRPLGFENCHKSVINQTYKNIKHIVSYDNDNDLQYLNNYRIEKVRVNKYKGEVLKNPDGYLFAPYNTYCNALLNKVESGWILFLDDDDHLIHNKVIEEIIKQIKKATEDSIFIWKMRYPNGKTVPSNHFFEQKEIQINNIGSPCILFHSKYKAFATWDTFKGADYRFINALFEKIPTKIWLKRVFIQINNFGDYGKRNDINDNLGLIYHKNLLWYLLPKKHYKLFNIEKYKKFIYKLKNMLFKRKE